MSLTAFFVRNCAGSSLRLKSISASFKDLQLKTDETYLFKSPEEYNAYRVSVQAWVQIKKIEIEPIVGAAAQKEIEKRIVIPDQNFNDFDSDEEAYGRETIEVKLPVAPIEPSQATDTENTESQDQETQEGSGSEGDVDTVKAEGTPTDDVAQDSPVSDVVETPVVDAQADLKQEQADLQALLKDTVDAEAKKKINARLKDIKKLLK